MLSITQLLPFHCSASEPMVPPMSSVPTAMQKLADGHETELK